MSQQERTAPTGYCECGCGQRTEIAKRTIAAKGWIKGQPRRFVLGHHMRRPEIQARVYTDERNAKIKQAHADGRIPAPEHQAGELHPSWRGRDIGYAQAHTRVVKAKGQPDRLSCDECGRPAAEWAVNHTHPSLRFGNHGGRIKPFSPDVAAYHPLCRACHRRADSSGGYTCPILS